MRNLWQRVVGWVTVYTIVLQAFSFGLMPAAAGANHNFDPFSIICSVGTSATTDTQDTAPSPHIAHSCDHCVLCSATTPPQAPDSAIKVSFIAPALPFSWPHTALPAHEPCGSSPELPTGPPTQL
jgi:hypothetical protein